VDWARTLRIDAPANESVQTRVGAALSRDGVRVRIGPENRSPHRYVLVEGPEGIDPAELRERLPDARWYDEAIIALAIELAPEDALQHVLHALRGLGAPAGMCDVTSESGVLIVEFRPSLTQPSLVLRIVDVELERFHGYRRTQLVAPLPVELVARIAADGLQAPEITTDRILESLLGRAHVE
jgi:hypothetical protein